MGRPDSSKNARTKQERAYCVGVIKRFLSVLLTLLLTKIIRTLSVQLISEQLDYIYQQTLKTLKILETVKTLKIHLPGNNSTP